MKTKITLFLIILGFTSLFSQVKENEISLKNKKGQARFIEFKKTKIVDAPQAIDIFLKTQYKTSNDIEFKVKRKSKIDNLGFNTKKIQQYYKGIKVEFATFNVVSKNNELKSITGNFLDIKNLNTQPNLTEQEVLEHVLKHINAEEYLWENPKNEAFLKKTKKNQEATYFPKGELVVIAKDRNASILDYVLAYKFNISASKPFLRKRVYVNAKNGEIILVKNLMMHVEGLASTRYYGQKTIETEQIGSQFRLKDNTRGNGIVTYNINNLYNYTNVTDFTDADNNWTSGEYNNAAKDNTALSIHWGAEMTYDYFLNTHNRNSLDNNGFLIEAYAHFGNNADNAFWVPSEEVLLFGDGGSTYDSLASLDVVAHEYGHGINHFTSNLNDERETGAINESLSDIWGAVVENHVFGTSPNTWLIGEKVALNAPAIRSMADPKSLNAPDTYRGFDYWEAATVEEGCINPHPIGNDNCGIHANSSVMNHWFYLLSEGSSATDEINDNDDVFSVQGIGIETAAEIVYRAQVTYFDENTTFHEARIHTIRAAEDIFGANSIEVVNTNNAWYAVGVGSLIDAQLEGDDCVCYALESIYTLTNPDDLPINWQISSNLQIVGTTSTSITVEAVSSYTSGYGFVSAVIAGVPFEKNVWVGTPSFPTSLYGATGVLYGAIVNYTGSSVQGATSYKWYLPYPFDQNATTTTSPPMWGILSGGDLQYMQAIAGPNNGLIQFMGENKCGVGGARTLNVTVGTSSPGVKPGGGNMPLSFSAIGGAKELLIYPNPAHELLFIETFSNTPHTVILYDVTGKVVLTKEISKDNKQVTVSAISNGIYFIQILGETSAIKKIIINH